MPVRTMPARVAVLAAILLLLPPATVAGPAAGAPAALRQQESDLLAGMVHAVCYSGFRQGQHPDRGDGAINPSDEQILEDLLLLTRDGNFRMIRLYDSHENAATTLWLIREHGLDLQVLLGAWLSAEVSNPGCPWMPDPIPEETLEANRRHNAEELQRLIRLARAYPEIVVAVAVGNEALVGWTDHLVPTETVIDYVRTVRDAVDQPVTVADNYDWWAKHGRELAAELDFVSVHIYPVWEDQPIDNGLAYGIANMQAVRNTLPDSRLVITEAGWASTAVEFGERAGQPEQKRYYEEIYRWAAQENITTFFFEAFDESWKGDPANLAGAEKHWGLFTEDRRPKLVMQDLYPDLEPAAADE